jgi:hypothetical protein
MINYEMENKNEDFGFNSTAILITTYAYRNKKKLKYFYLHQIQTPFLSQILLNEQIKKWTYKKLRYIPKVGECWGVGFYEEGGKWIQDSEYFDEETAKEKCLLLDKIRDTNGLQNL